MKRMLVDPSATIVFFTILASFTDRPYGLFLAFVRRKAGIAVPKAQGT